MPRQQVPDRRRAVRADRSERTVVFGKTKLCKFQILGVCSKGAECNFAHDAVELHQPPDLAKTKVCKALINTGRCDDPDCRYAHNREEIREMPTAAGQPARSRPAAQSLEVQNPPAAPPVLPVIPNFAAAFGQQLGQPFGQPFGQPGGQSHDPQAQAMVLQQLAAQLSMQAAMIQAAHGSGWPGQPGTSPAAQWLSPPQPPFWPQPHVPGDAQQRDTRLPKAVPEELASVPPQPNVPAFVGGQDSTGAERHAPPGARGSRGWGGDGAEAPQGTGKNQRRIQNGRINVPGADSFFSNPQAQMPNGLTAASMASPLMLPTNFEQDPPSLLLGSLFDSPKSQRDLDSPKSPGFGESPLFYLKETEAPPLFMLNETEVTVKDAEEEPPRGRLDPEVLAFDERRGARLWSQGGEKRLQDTPVLGGGGITVKHTFLEIQPEWPKVGMRSVQTHSGSLCLMTEQDEDDDDFAFRSRLASLDGMS